MDISVIGKFKSIEPLEWKAIPNFAVLIGPNGVGKSQLLDLIYESIIHDKKYNQLISIANSKIKPYEVNYVRDWNLSNTSGVDLAEYQQTLRQSYHQFKQFQPRISYEQSNALYHEIFSRSGKANPSQVTQDEFTSLYEQSLSHKDLGKNIENLFYNWRLEEIDLRSQGQSENIIKEKLGEKPWIILEWLLKESNLLIGFNNPENMSLKERFCLTVINKKNNENLNLADLSSGEKVLISTILYLYKAENISFHKLLLLDEPDAHLHPSMSKIFLDIIKKILVDKLNVQVIMTTHSPCTVALCPKDSLFEMTQESPRIKKINSINNAIFCLTSGLVYVNNGAKYILVEDQDDVNFYHYLYSQLYDDNFLNKGIPLLFIPAYVKSQKKDESKSGGTTVVSGWVQKLANSGLTDIIYGIIDKDHDSQKIPGIFPIERYCIENYLVDPIIIYGTLIEADITLNIPDITYDSHTVAKINEESEERLQIIANYIFQLIEPYLSQECNKGLIQVSFTNNKKLSYPNWIKSLSGKDIIHSCSQVKEFRGKVNHGTLFKALKRIRLIPIDFLNLFQSIQNQMFHLIETNTSDVSKISSEAQV